MNKNNVFTTPFINNYKNYALKVFDHNNTKQHNLIYLVNYKAIKNSEIPKSILNFYKDNICGHVDGDIIYLPKSVNNAPSCIVMYGKDKIKNISKHLGAIVSSKIKFASSKLHNKLSGKDYNDFFLGWGLEQYKFNDLSSFKSIYMDYNKKYVEIISLVSGIYYGKELINIPSSDMRPNNLEMSFINFAEHHGLDYKIFKNSIIENSFPLIHAVGKGSTTEPRLLELNTSNNNYPLVILVGKGVCYDTGGLDLKPSQYMRNMKKDMGGAASILSLANVILESNLKINLKVLIPTVDNDIGPNSMRPGDVYNSKAGITVEIGNTDAEGRLILADTLYYADSFKPNLLIDFATLTGAARIALGPDLPAYFTNSEKVASLINNISIDEGDPLWRLPLWLPYMEGLKSNIADVSNISAGPLGGAITASLFLNKFIKKNTNWLHIDTYAWNDKYKPGHSVGGEILGVRSIYKLIKSYLSNL